MSQEKIISQIESTSEKDLKTSSKTLGFETKLPKLSVKENQLHLWLCPQTFSTYTLNGDPPNRDGSWVFLLWQEPPLKLLPGTDNCGSCNPVGWMTGVSHTITSYPVGISSDMVQPKSKPASLDPQLPPHIPRMGHIPGMASDPSVTDTDHV